MIKSKLQIELENMTAARNYWRSMAEQYKAERDRLRVDLEMTNMLVRALESGMSDIANSLYQQLRDTIAERDACREEQAEMQSKLGFGKEDEPSASTEETHQEGA